MKAVLDSFASGRGGSTSNTLTWTHTILQVANRFIIAVGSEKTGGGHQPWCTSLTINGVSANLVARDGNNNQNSTECHIYELRNADGSPFLAGTYTIVAHFDKGTDQPQSQTGISAAFRLLRNVDAGSVNSEGALGTVVAIGNGNGGYAWAKSITPDFPNTLLIGCIASQNAGAIQSLTSQGTVINNIGTGSGEEMALMMMYTSLQTEDIYNFTGTLSNPETYGICLKGFPIKHVPGVQITEG